MWKLSGNAQSDGLSYSRRTGNDVNVEEEKKKAIEEMWKITADAQSISKQRSYLKIIKFDDLKTKLENKLILKKLNRNVTN